MNMKITCRLKIVQKNCCSYCNATYLHMLYILLGNFAHSPLKCDLLALLNFLNLLKFLALVEFLAQQDFLALLEFIAFLYFLDFLYFIALLDCMALLDCRDLPVFLDFLTLPDFLAHRLVTFPCIFSLSFTFTVHFSYFSYVWPCYSFFLVSYHIQPLLPLLPMFNHSSLFDVNFYIFLNIFLVIVSILQPIHQYDPLYHFFYQFSNILNFLVNNLKDSLALFC